METRAKKSAKMPEPLDALVLVAVSRFPRRREIETACLALANACRNGVPCSISVAAFSAPTLLRSLMPTLPTSGQLSGGGNCGSSGVSRLARHGIVRRLRIEGNFDLRLMSWPEGLEEVVFAGEFDQSLEGVRWPSSLLKIESVGVFDQPLHFWADEKHRVPIQGKMVLPPCLKELVLGGNFNRNVCNVLFPPGLERLMLGSEEDGVLDSEDDDDIFDDAISGEYPDEPSFNRPITSVKWPPGLKKLEFGNRFNKPVEGCSFPDSLHEIVFGSRFDQPIEGVKWPAELRRLCLGEDFYQDLGGVVWPSKLEEVTVHGEMDSPSLLDYDMDGVVWPASMREVTFTAGTRCLSRVDLLGKTGGQ